VSIGHGLSCGSASGSRFTIALACLEPCIATGEYSPFSFGVRRILAAIRDRPELLGVEIRLIERDDSDLDAWLAAIAERPPDILGLSTFVWSFPFFVALTRRLREEFPAMRIVFGGPCARPVMFRLPSWSDPAGWPDALVVDEGEVIAARLFAAWRAGDEIDGIGGVAVPRAKRGNLASGWLVAPQPAVRPDLDKLPSPHCAGMILPGRTASIETYRGCPMGCTFCQWGVLESPKRIVSAATLTRDLEALALAGVASAQLVDAGLNLNERAFRALCAAESDVGFFDNARLFASIYPTQLKNEHLELLAGVKRPRLDVGVQTFAPAALSAVERPFQRDRLYRLIEQLAGVAEIEIELIMGLPGDDPGRFGETVREAMELPATLRIFHCLALPDALLDRSDDGAMVVDDVSLRVLSNSAWSAEQIEATRTGLDALVGRNNGECSADTWQLPTPDKRHRDDMRLDRGADGSGLVQGERAAIEAALRRAGADGWQLVAAQGAGSRVLIALRHDGGELTVSLSPSRADSRVFLTASGVDVGYRVTDGDGPDGGKDGPFAKLCRQLVDDIGVARCGSQDPVQRSDR